MKVLITGGAGFIGSHLSRHLAEEGYNVTICDNLFRGNMDRELKDLISRKNVKFLELDLLKKENMNALEKDYDCVYHLAAINGTRLFYEMPVKVLTVNIISLINMLNWIRDTSCKKLIWPSSSEAYAGAPDTCRIKIPTPEDVPLVIKDVSNPRFSYAGSKIAGELLCLNYARTYNLDITIVRPHNIYGPRMGHEHVIPEFIVRILEKKDPFKIHGGSQTRAFCYIDDFVRGIRLAGESAKSRGEIINIGNDLEEILIKDLAEKMFRFFGFRPKMEMLSAPKGCVQRRCPDITKARKLLGYEPRVNLETGLKKTHEWYSGEAGK